MQCAFETALPNRKNPRLLKMDQFKLKWKTGEAETKTTSTTSQETKEQHRKNISALSRSVWLGDLATQGVKVIHKTVDKKGNVISETPLPPGSSAP